jgi:SAM-dependent methyltransferase
MMTACLAEQFKHVCGIDVSAKMIDQARENLRAFDNVRLDVGNGYDLQIYDDGHFDFVFSYITFQHIPDAKITANYIREAGRVLKSGGYFYFQVNDRRETLRTRLRPRTRLKTFLEILKGRRGTDTQDEGRSPTDLDHPAWKGSRFSLAQVREACAQGGMRVVDPKGQGTQYLWVKATKQCGSV